METIKNINGAGLLAKSMKYLVIFSLLAFTVTSCNKDKDKEKAHISVRLTDAPGDFDAVWVDIQGVELTGNNGSATLLYANTGLYNLLDFSNGLDTLIAAGDIDAGPVSQIRLILGPNNTVVVDSVIFPLSTPSAMQSGLKLQLHRSIEPGDSYRILLDFDANQSVVLKGNGEYQLKPVIRTIDLAITGSIRGQILPAGLNMLVQATTSGITYTSVTNTDGAFLIAGLPAGIYDFTVIPALPIWPVSVSGVVVTAGVSTNLGNISL